MTYTIVKQDLDHLRMLDYIIKKYISDIVIPKFDINLSKSIVNYDLIEGELIVTERPKEEKKDAK